MTLRRKAAIQPKVRLPEELHKRLWRSAEKAGRSLNQEIVDRLEASFAKEAEDDRLRRMAELVMNYALAGQKR
jgi:hypothetical protein